MSLIQDFQDDCHVRGISTAKGYAEQVHIFEAFLNGASLEGAGKEEFKAWLVSLREHGLKPATIDRYFASITAFYAYLVDEGILESNPVLPFRRRYLRKYKENESESRQLISVEQMATMINATLGSRDRAIITLLAKTGMRRGELSRLDVDDISLERMEIKLKPTAKRSNRLLFFDYETADILETWLKARKNIVPGPTLFGLGGHGIEVMIEKRAAVVGLHRTDGRIDERFTPHCCRHWFTTHLLRSGMRREYVQWLRGDRIKEAVDIYYHIDSKDVRESYLAHIPQLGI